MTTGSFQQTHRKEIANDIITYTIILNLFYMDTSNLYSKDLFSLQRLFLTPEHPFRLEQLVARFGGLAGLPYPGVQVILVAVPHRGQPAMTGVHLITCPYPSKYHLGPFY